MPLTFLRINEITVNFFPHYVLYSFSFLILLLLFQQVVVFFIEICQNNHCVSKKGEIFAFSKTFEVLSYQKRKLISPENYFLSSLL